ncbi:hypothetical protein [Arthrobacter sp. 31Y]|uniref:hypothetical protein n=1 Tax=Arthrobacter sp. 31Y TaxID=1115632 RepID=UPI0004657C1C|nr:hypothetical protein [Arthrobacter sp. 31Y]
MSREEAAAKAIHQHHWGDNMENRPTETKALYRERAKAALAAADAHDAANGVHRVTLDEATVERVTESVWPFATAHYLQAYGETQDEAQARGLRERQLIVRAVLAAAVKEGQ